MEGFYRRSINSGATPIALTATGDDFTMTADQPVDVIAVGFLVTATFSSSGNTVVAFDKRPTAGSDTGRGDADVASLSIPTTTAAGKLFLNELATPIEIDAGEQIVAQVTTASSSAGSGIYVVYFQPRPIHSNDARTAAAGNRNANVVLQA